MSMSLAAADTMVTEAIMAANTIMAVKPTTGAGLQQGSLPEPQPPRRAKGRRPRRITIILRHHIIGGVGTLIVSATTLRLLNVPNNDDTERP